MSIVSQFCEFVAIKLLQIVKIVVQYKCTKEANSTYKEIEMEIRNDIEAAIEDLRKMTSVDTVLEEAIDDIEHYATIAARSVELLSAVLSCVDKLRDGDWYFTRQTGIVLLPEQLSIVLADVEAFLDNSEFRKRQ
jgi:hypothetical protein